MRARNKFRFVASARRGGADHFKGVGYFKYGDPEALAWAGRLAGEDGEPVLTLQYPDGRSWADVDQEWKLRSIHGTGKIVPGPYDPVPDPCPLVRKIGPQVRSRGFSASRHNVLPRDLEQVGTAYICRCGGRWEPSFSCFVRHVGRFELEERERVKARGKDLLAEIIRLAGESEPRWESQQGTTYWIKDNQGECFFFALRRGEVYPLDELDGAIEKAVELGDLDAWLASLQPA
ncbi:hypothetical protein HY375_02345 [Candidatus Berkelbacteria bacterium]|nr:hypothetical protein [Candidatus Berkelbacteria bacterium]